ncbi:MAG: acyl-CoA thioesterase [Verrucomicrobia bacterium]|jgi:YbgC/YbaW family acyl-CoA thioester hydrolase|nr:acyl-CoA thioesterase [Verrucomicrobiota bacterium]OQC62650.1 MAG: acyl-CoA thioesterase YbgC [Verrucomicrobia bacterium ADurb.Bin006]MDI9379538.1 thioesterase family protein [Verrucomicrobiota bacterium]NMD21534.1 acyl-CoA thioesterase [Verrucomicrobiota bacterium]HOA62296.1 thioesterase family protein [Verrucomicrobiota bacterium]
MAFEIKLQRRVEFSETDAAGIVHFSNFFRYMESAEHAFFRSLGYSIMMRRFDPPLGFPRVHVSCDYRSPLRFEDLVEVHLLVRMKKAKVLSYLVKFRNLTAEPSVEAARGVLTVVCVTHASDGQLKARPIPQELADAIEVAPAELLA